MRQRENDNEGDLAAPEALISALKQVPGKGPFIPAATDDAILRAARRHLRPEATPRIFGFRFWRWAAGGAGVCALALVLIQANRSGINSSPGFAREDVNHDGRVDILDAFALARQLRAGSAPGILDVNGDGAVDERDVTALASHAVQLPSRGGRS